MQLGRLKPKERRGSKPRCHLLTSGQPAEVAARLTALIDPFGSVNPDDSWMPEGFEDVEEAQLHKAPRLIAEPVASKLRDWWLAPGSHRALTPNFDIASTCSVAGTPGILLIEAKAHEAELLNECHGRKLDSRPRRDGQMPDPRALSHDTIGDAISEACAGLASATGLRLAISRDRCYQMSNRFAWAWKLTQLGIPVVLVYLGFLNCDEMRAHSDPFASDAVWTRLVLEHSAPLFPETMWNRPWACNGQTLIPLVRSLEQPLPSAR